MDPYNWSFTRKYTVLVVNFLNLFLCCGFPFNMSVLNVEFLRVFGESKAQTALIQAVTTGILDIAGFIGGQFIDKYGVRITGICGGLLALIGLAGSFLATGIPYLIVSIGVVSGCGFSLAHVSSYTSVGEYFDGKAKLVAISVIGVGSGCGSMAFPFLMDYLIELYGWRGCVLIVGGLMGNMIGLFAICKPKLVGMSKHKYKLTSAEEPDIRLEGDINQEVNNVHKTDEKYSGTEKLKQLSGNNIFIIFILGMCLTLSAFISTLIYMLDFLQTKGFDEHESLLLYFYMNISTTLSRLLPGLCILVPGIDGLVVSAIATAMGCVSGVGLVLSYTYYQHAILMCVFGMVQGCGNTVLSMTTMELVGLDNYAIGMGVLTPAVGVSSICAGAVSGWLVDVTGSHYASYYSLSAAHGMATCLFILAAALRKSYRKSDKL